MDFRRDWRAITKVIGALTPILLAIFGNWESFLKYSNSATAIILKATPLSYIYCRHYECCAEPWIPGGETVDSIREKILQQVYGQDFAVNVTLNVTSSRLNAVSSHSKPLMIFFHGTTGIGKTFFADLLVNTLYKKGRDSEFVYWDNKATNETSAKTEILEEEIYKRLKKCSQSIFVIDEMGRKTTSGPAFDKLKHLFKEGNKLTKDAIFIFITNIGQEELADYLDELNKDGGRNDIDKRRVRDILTKAIVEMERHTKTGQNPLQEIPTHHSLVSEGIVAQLVPFLPLERDQVRMCIKAYLEKERFRYDEKTIEEVLEQVSFNDKGMARVGCREVENNVNLLGLPKRTSQTKSNTGTKNEEQEMSWNELFLCFCVTLILLLILWYCYFSQSSIWNLHTRSGTEFEAEEATTEAEETTTEEEEATTEADEATTEEEEATTGLLVAELDTSDSEPAAPSLERLSKKKAARRHMSGTEYTQAPNTKDDATKTEPVPRKSSTAARKEAHGTTHAKLPERKKSGSTGASNGSHSGRTALVPGQASGSSKFAQQSKRVASAAPRKLSRHGSDAAN